MSKIKARVLAAFPDGDVNIPVNAIVLAAEGTITALQDGGLVDSNADAVTYAEKQGAKSFDLSGGAFDQSVQSRIDEKSNEPKKLTDKQAKKVIAEMTAAEKSAFEKSGVDIDAWLSKEAADRDALVQAEQAAIDAKAADDAAIAALSDAEKPAFEKSGLTIGDWNNLADQDRNARITALTAAE